MKLKKATIYGYRSINREVTLLINNRVTILIGSNDHGKSNVLDAVKCLNDDFPITAEDKNWDLASENEPKIVWTFELSEEEITAFKTKFEHNPTEETEPQSLFGNNDKNELSFYRAGINQPVKVYETPCSVKLDREAEMLTLRPRVELFGTPSPKIDDKITLAELNDNAHDVMKGMFIEAGIWENRAELFGASTTTSSRALTRASELLTKKLKTDWSQGSNLKWKIQRENETTIEIMIEDPAVSRADVKLSKRSSGFKSYFYLHMSIRARMYDSFEGNGYIFMFDEPGTYLHPRAQIDLQRAMELHANKGQIIYTSHSLFLVSKNYPERNRVISKGTDGTMIDAKPFTKNWKAIREALGILMINNFLIADKTLLVEGPSDRLYVGTALQILKRAGAFDIDLNDFSDVDAGSSENYTAMAKLMKSEGRNIVCLSDGDSGGTDLIERTKKACINEPVGNTEYIQLGENMSSEDVFADLVLLKRAIKEAAEGVVATSERAFVEEFNMTEKLGEIEKERERTLGRTIQDKTKTWFTDGESLSKLSIAAKYAEIVRPSELDGGTIEGVNLPPEATTVVKKIAKKLGLKKESAAEHNVLSDEK